MRPDSLTVPQGKELMSGGLGALETLGKKTMEVLSEGDPGVCVGRGGDACVCGWGGGDVGVGIALFHHQKVGN